MVIRDERSALQKNTERVNTLPYILGTGSISEESPPARVSMLAWAAVWEVLDHTALTQGYGAAWLAVNMAVLRLFGEGVIYYDEAEGYQVADKTRKY